MGNLSATDTRYRRIPTWAETRCHWIQTWAAIALLALAAPVAAQDTSGKPAGPAVVSEAAEPAGPAVVSEAAEPEEGEVTVPEAQVETVSPSVPSAREILTAEWNRTGRSLSGRVGATRERLVELGMVGFPPAARALILDETLGDELTRAEGAVALAPGLPDSHAFHALALLADGSPLASLRAWARSAAAARGHFEGRVWLQGHGWAWLALVLVLGGALYLLVAGCIALPRLAVRFAGPERSIPLAAGVALLLIPVAVPGVLGVGILGMLLVLGALALAAGSGLTRLCVGAAGAACILGTYPALDGAVRSFGMVGSDPVAEAAYNIDWETASAIDLARVRTEDVDPMARRALATWDRRRGRLQSALDRYEGLLGAQAATEMLNNAANLRLSLGDAEAAIGLYERAAKQSRDPAILINLAEAYGRTIRLDEQNLALAEAQLIDAAAVDELTHGDEATRLRDMGISVEEMGRRLELRPRVTHAAALRAGIAPAIAEERWVFVLALFGGFALASIALGQWLPDGRSVSAYLDGRAEQTHGRGATTDPFERLRRAGENRTRKKRLRWVSLGLGSIVPGAAALLGAKPLTGFFALFGFAAAGASWLLRNGIFPDPLAAGLLLHGLAVMAATLAMCVFAWCSLSSLYALWRD